MKRFAVVGLGLLLLVGTSPLVRAADEGEKTLTGEVVDTFCFAAMGAKGASHKKCAIDCAKKGIPAGLLEQGTNKVSILLPNKDKTALPDTVINKMGDTTTITGQSYTTGGTTFLTVESVK